jgi:hypothetical protein
MGLIVSKQQTARVPNFAPLFCIGCGFCNSAASSVQTSDCRLKCEVDWAHWSGMDGGASGNRLGRLNKTTKSCLISASCRFSAGFPWRLRTAYRSSPQLSLASRPCKLGCHKLRGFCLCFWIKSHFSGFREQITGNWADIVQISETELI